jgi:6-pyruvoyl tetrahydropterin synthase/QueD family protein
MYTITKEVYFCYGHRLMNHPGKCRNLHGHSVKASISVQRSQLNEQGMVCDFSDIKVCVEAYIDEHLDHNFLLHKDDPIIPVQDYHELRANELTCVAVEPHGGHNGFLDGPRLRSRYETWLADMFDGYGAARP